MNAPNCPKCGGRTRSSALGWICENCSSFIDMHGNFHEHIDRPFMPQMTNSDRIRAMSDDKLAVVLAEEVTERCLTMLENNGKLFVRKDKSYIKHNLQYFDMRWLQEPANIEMSIAEFAHDLAEKSCRADLLRPSADVLENIEKLLEG